jgi:hypothetical protein
MNNFYHIVNSIMSRELYTQLQATERQEDATHLDVNQFTYFRGLMRPAVNHRAVKSLAAASDPLINYTAIRFDLTPQEKDRSIAGRQPGIIIISNGHNETDVYADGIQPKPQEDEDPQWAAMWKLFHRDPSGLLLKDPIRLQSDSRLIGKVGTSQENPFLRCNERPVESPRVYHIATGSREELTVHARMNGDQTNDALFLSYVRRMRDGNKHQVPIAAITRTESSWQFEKP